MNNSFKVRDLRKKDQYKIDDAYLNGYAKLCGVYATAVYNSLSRHADFHTQECFPSIELIADQHAISKPSVIKAINELITWGIVKKIKEKDNKTKRQLPNVYILADKSEWIEKPTRVNLIDSESRVNDSEKPSKPHDKSRVNDVYCKDTHIKDTHIKDTHIKGSDDVAEIIKSFETIDSKNKNYYGNTTQRKAVTFLLKEYGKNVVLHVIETVLPTTNERPRYEFPHISTPFQLMEHWVKVKDGIKTKKQEIHTLKDSVAF